MRVPLRLYDSLRRELVDFVSVTPGAVGMYICGPTVQSSPHIGHLRSALVYDQLRRWLVFSGYDVTFVRNVTDIDDKILAGVDGTSEQWWALAYRIEREFTAAYGALNILPPTYEPRATASISQMIEIICRLIADGYAYPAADGSADVYFDTTAWPTYGELTRQKREDMVAAADSSSIAKRDPRDFALWKAHKKNEPDSAAWNSPWGLGRPGWHIECSAMASRYLGRHFDIHGGGLDLRFPHHENELAQSNAAGEASANYWLHNGLVTVAGQKMSKSLGNSVFAAELLASARPLVVRYYLGSAHYRSTLEFHSGALDEAEAALGRIESFLDRAARRLRDTRFISAIEHDIPVDFFAAMNDDLSVPQALAVLHETVRSGNSALDAENFADAAISLGQVHVMASVLGINPTENEWASAQKPAEKSLTVLVERLLEDRQRARENHDFSTADRIRDELSQAGITVEDTSSGVHWSCDG